MKKCFLFVFLVIAVVEVNAQNDPIADRLQNSPRHQEWVQIPSGGRTLHVFQVYPEVSEKAMAVIVIHENRGLNDWARSMADQIAEMGYIAIAPDLLSGSGPNSGKTSDFSNSDEARNAIYTLAPDQVTTDLNAVHDYVKTLKACNGKVAVIGFCWGGSQTFRYVTNQQDLEMALVCYGSAPSADYTNINVPVYGFYGGNDARVNAGIPEAEKEMQANNKFYEPVIYDGAGHGFFRAGEMPDASKPNKMARDEGLARIKKLLAEANK